MWIEWDLVSLNSKQVKLLLKFFNLIQPMYNGNNRTKPYMVKANQPVLGYPKCYFHLGCKKKHCCYKALDLAYVHLWACAPYPVLWTVKTVILVGRILKPTIMFKWSKVQTDQLCRWWTPTNYKLQGNKIITRWHEVDRWRKLFRWSCCISIAKKNIICVTARIFGKW